MEGLRNYNKVILVGRLTHSPELRYTPKGAPVVRFNLAVNHKKNKRDEALFIDIVAWNKLAEFCAQYFQKGKGIYVEGYLSLRKWQSDDNSQRSKIEVIAEKLSFLEGYSTAGEDADSAESMKSVGIASPARFEDETTEESIPF